MMEPSLKQKVVIEASIGVSLEKAWEYFTDPEHVTKWNYASDDWHCPRGTNDVRTGGSFNFRMEAKDGSSGFDFAGVYDEVIFMQKIAYTLGDRKVEVNFSEEDGETKVTVVFEAENENPIEMQREGWQAILDNYKKHSEGK